MVLLCVVPIVARAQQSDSLLVMFWNLENFFDWKDQGTGESDKEFSSYGARSWIKSRFYSKCSTISKAIFFTADKYGRVPDVLGLCEVENRGVLSRLLSSTLLRKFDYSIVHFDSGDRRGIDVALLYRKSTLQLLSTSFKTPVFNGEKMSTRDMLHAQMKCISSGDTLDFIVCHHPSKYGGEEHSRSRRIAAMKSLRELCDSLGSYSKVVMGDFNDIPSAEQFNEVSEILINKSEILHNNGEGTIRYKGKWELIDMFLTSYDIGHLTQMQIIKIPFLMTYDKSFPGEKPLRTYSGPKYLGGVSDHCPIILRLAL